MKFLNFVMFVMMINISIAVVNASGILSTSHQSNNEWINKVYDENLADASYVQGQVSSDSVSLGYGDFVRGLWQFVSTFSLGVVWMPFLYSQFGLSFPYTYYFTVPIWMIYSIALIQIVANRQFKSMS